MKKKLIALACAGTLLLAFTACSPTESSTTTVTSAKPSTSTSAETAAGAASSETSSEASDEVIDTATAESADTAAQTSAEDASAASDAGTDVSGDLVADASSAAQDAASDTADSAGGLADAAAGALVDSAQASEINNLLSTGDFSGALSTVQGIGNETLTQAMQALADAAAACNVATEPNSGNIIVYGDDAEVVDGTTNVIPFVNMTHDFTHLQIGFVDRTDDPNGYHNASPTAVTLAAGGENWTWDTDSTNTVTVPGDTSTTWVFETALSDSELPLLMAVGNAQPGAATVTFTDAEAGNRDYTLSDAEIGAFGNLGQFSDALQQLKSCLGA